MMTVTTNMTYPKYCNKNHPLCLLIATLKRLPSARNKDYKSVNMGVSIEKMQ